MSDADDNIDDNIERDRTRDEHRDPADAPRTLGIERWVQFAFVAVAGLVFFIGDKLIYFIWDQFGEPNATLVSGAAAILGLVVGYVLYRHDRVKPWVDDVAGELAKVTWPSRDETWRNTVVVIVTSVIAAVLLGVFDAAWSAFTDLIYSTT
ncbi:MAG: preprotein translocase subunit SecE [Sandaracinaceae bacterium]